MSSTADREKTRAVESIGALAELAARFHPPGAPISCVRPKSEAHRRSDWRGRSTPPGAYVCGVCHPPPVDDRGVPLIGVEPRRLAVVIVEPAV